MIEVRKAPADSPEAVMLMRELSDTLLSVTGRSGEASFRAEAMDAPRNVFAVAYLNGASAGCGAIREISPDTCELKRMYARDKGLGVGRAILGFLEQQAARLNYARIILETGTVNEGAVRFYLANGYSVTENFGNYAGRDDSVCFVKILQLQFYKNERATRSFYPTALRPSTNFRERVERAEALSTFNQIQRPARWIWLFPKGRACPADGECVPEPVSARKSPQGFEETGTVPKAKERCEADFLCACRLCRHAESRRIILSDGSAHVI